MTESRKRDSLFRLAVLLSILLHVGMWGFFSIKGWWNRSADVSTIEIDLTKPFRIGGNPLLKPGGGTTLKEVPLEKQGPPKLATLEEIKKAEEEKKPEEKPKDWVLPTAETKVIEKPKAEVSDAAKSVQGIEDGTGQGYTGTGGPYGGGDGEGGGLPLSKYPSLLNRSEVLKLQKKLYRRSEKLSGRQGDVVVHIHVGTDGSVSGVDIIRSPGREFDEVALQVVAKMKYSPAMMKDRPVAFKIQQVIAFRLEE